MFFAKSSLLAMAAVAVNLCRAAPEGHVARTTYYYDASNPPVIFTNATCSLEHYLTPGEPLSFAYPAATSLGALIGPTLTTALGDQTIEDIDDVADQLCVDAEQDPTESNGICQDALQAIDDFVTTSALNPTLQAQRYQCLLDLLCIAHTGVPYNSLCDYLLAGSDCIANRIVGADDLECD